MKKPLAVFTLARNEPVFLPLWLRHYTRTGADLHVLDHETDDLSLEDALLRHPNTVVHPVAHTTADDADWMRVLVECTFRELLESYDRVIYTAAAEFLTAATPYSGLAEYLARHPAAARLTATGFDVCDTYPGIPLTADGDPLEGRRLRRNANYDKTLIGREPIQWEAGFHRPAGQTPYPLPDMGLILLHLHYASRETAWERLSRRRGRDGGPPDRDLFDRNFDEACGGSYEMPAWLLGAI